MAAFNVTVPIAARLFKTSYMRMLVIFLVSGAGANAQTNIDANGKWKIISSGIQVPYMVDELKGLKMGPFVRLADGNILTVDSTRCYVSKDGGDTWDVYPIFPGNEDYLIRPERALIRTKTGVIILAFKNAKNRHWDWQPEIFDSPNAIQPTYTIRSLDEGKTWQDLQILHEDWTGAIRDMIETADGNIIFTSMMMRHDPGRQTVVTYTSMNGGRTWHRSNIIDLGGIGHHGGVSESTLEQLKNSRLWMLFRTNWGQFWEAYSDDEGLTWRDIRATAIPASSAPGLLTRLASGRLMLVWNLRYPEGKNEYPLRGGDNQWSEVPVSNHREELSVAFSDDEGKTWTQPTVLAKTSKAGSWISYPYVFEAHPGELWITTMQGGLRIKLYEKNFI